MLALNCIYSVPDYVSRRELYLPETVFVSGVTYQTPKSITVTQRFIFHEALLLHTLDIHSAVGSSPCPCTDSLPEYICGYKRPLSLDIKNIMPFFFF